MTVILRDQKPSFEFRGEIMQMFKDHIDKILLMCLIVGMMFFLNHMFSIKADDTAISWLQQNITTAQGCLLGLITGQLIRNKQTQPGGDPASTVSTSTTTDPSGSSTVTVSGPVVGVREGS